MLVAPINKLTPLQERILEFKGLNRKNVVDDGELHDMKNLSSDEYPCLYQRKPRGVFTGKPADCIKPLSMIQKKSKLGVLGYKADGNIRFFYDGYEISALGNFSEATTMVAINTRICFFPENKAYNIGTKAVSNLAATATIASSTMIIDKDSGLAKLTVSSEVSAMFKEDDVVEVEGTFEDYTYSGNTWVDDTHKPKLSSLVKGFSNGNIHLEADAFMDLSSATTGTVTVSCSNVTLTRPVPSLKYVMESNNRLWGVSDEDNTIYASKLGDPTNWQYFQTTSMDSYYAEQGTDGEWTGCAAYSNHLMFFKEGVIHKVYGTSPSSYQITTTQCYGLEKGSANSVAIINDMVIYKSQIGFMAYEGGSPYCISQKFSNMKFNNVVAGSNGLKYYASIHDKDTDESWIVVCDVEKGLWHKEDNVPVRDFCFFNGKLIFIADKGSEYFDKDRIYIIDADEGMQQEKDIVWWVELGPFDEFVEEKKIYSKLDMRLDIPVDTVLDFYIKLDSGEWEFIDRRTHTHELTIRQIIAPRRCNKFSIRIEGKGNCRIDSLRRRYRVGTGGEL